MNSELLGQLAHSTLLPKEESAAILAGNTPPMEEIVKAVIIGAMDAHAVVLGDPASSWNEKGLARMALAIAFLAAMVLLGQGEA